MTYTRDFFTPQAYKKYFGKAIDPKALVLRCGQWGILMTPDGKTRPDVPQCEEGISTGRAACHLTNILLGFNHI